MASMSNPVQQLITAEKKAAVLVNDARSRECDTVACSSNFRLDRSLLVEYMAR